ncbi:hypothetical protein HG1285_03018 [Hydrogenivirga sp. 128-5-R1-1]|nr:hypothetical protein HG1285_03018 [Hydrogenivirga sp. 128-5-R1-1]
MKVKAETFLP